MAATADSSNHHSPCGAEFSGDGPNSPRHPRRSNLSSPWAQVVRGEPEPRTSEVTPSAEQTIFSNCSAPKLVPSSPSPMPPADNSGAELSDGGDKSNAARSKPVWNKPSNGVVEGGAVMGAASWPALSTRASPKSLVDSSPKDVDASVSTSQASPVIPLSPNKQSASVNTNSTRNHALPRQRSMKRGSGSHSGGGPLQSGFTRPPPPPPPPQFPVFRVPPNSYGALMPPMADSSPRESPYRGSTWQTRPMGGFVPQPHFVNDHRNSSRRGNYGPRGDASYHNNFGGRRDHDRGNTRETHLPSPRGPPRGIVRAPPPLPPSTAPFVSSQTMRPFLTPPIAFADVTSPLYYYPQLPMDSFRGVPFVAPPPPVLIPSPEPTIPGLIIKQIEYYFSDANLMTDDFLKSHMDSQGWVPVTLIAGFPRVKSLTNNIQLILDTLRTSVVVEVQDDKLRRRNEWMKWIPNLSTESGSPSSGAGKQSMFATSFQNGKTGSMGDTHLEPLAGRTSPGEQLSNGGDTS